MKIKKIERQSRRDFYAVYECEHCGFIQRGSGYHDDHFHRNVIPKMKCPECNNTSPENYRPMGTKYPSHLVMQNIKRDFRNECYYCAHKRPVPGNCHIKCVKPDAFMTGNPHGIKEGWFMYPLLFDPVWKTSLCGNFEFHKSVKHAVSGAVSQETNGQDAQS